MPRSGEIFETTVAVGEPAKTRKINVLLAQKMPGTSKLEKTRIMHGRNAKARDKNADVNTYGLQRSKVYHSRSFQLNLLFWSVVVLTAGSSAFLLASLAEWLLHKAVLTSMAGAFGGAIGQYAGRWFAGILTNPNDKWLSNLEFERLYRLNYILAQFILIAAILCGFMLGFAITTGSIFGAKRSDEEQYGSVHLREQK